MISPYIPNNAALVADAIWMIAPLLVYVGYWSGGYWFTRQPLDETTFNAFAAVTCAWFYWGWM